MNLEKLCLVVFTSFRHHLSTTIFIGIQGFTNVFSNNICLVQSYLFINISILTVLKKFPFLASLRISKKITGLDLDIDISDLQEAKIITLMDFFKKKHKLLLNLTLSSCKTMSPTLQTFSSTASS